MIQPPHALLFNTMKLALIYTLTLFITEKLEIAKALACHSVEINLPKHYAPNREVPEGKMRVVGIKAKKISLTKAVLIVKFISQSSLKNVQMQMFYTSLEPNTKQGQDADLSIMTALTLTNPGAKSFCKIIFSLQTTLRHYTWHERSLQ